MNKVKYLLTYRYALMIHDLTVVFVQKYIEYKSRTRDQMEQAARSGKQNIVEGVSQSTSLKTQIKLLGVSVASFEELTADYEDYLRQHNLETYPKTDSKVRVFRDTGYRLSALSNLSPLGDFIEKPTFPGNPTDDANFLLTLCHIVTFLLSKQIKAAEEKFVSGGGYTETLFRKRLKFSK
ncbi:four helix bundle protein [Candidatus Gottesmanbacteria bacterium]|nr:four helix bundle protein [Candidatus Gottesmanbacteria bacterium]